MFEKFEHQWQDAKTRKPHDIRTLLNIGEYLSYLDKDRLQSHRFKKHLFVLDSKNVVSPTPERTEMNKFDSNILDQLLKWAGRGSMSKKGHTCLMPMYINIPQQPND
ncbi:hypothetical protein PIB30_017932 [Stylosanthes scabra]|uniref:Uncharacterized protein n=1 Tax=Stylosanthes scabra TaxID=79078 RepID=A0ABU6R813_9FABA|nr:hypothetical protein [Stylosanthes scabra]